MWETLGNAMKVFLEKHFIPTVISITAAILAILFVPSDYWMIVKVGKLLFFILIFCLTLLLTEVIIAVAKCLKKRGIKRKNEKYYEQQSIKEEQESLEKIWNTVDLFSPNDRQLIYRFLETNNAPVYDTSFYMPDSLFGTNMVKTTKANIKGGTILASGYELKIDKNATIEGQAYMLADQWFEILKYSKEKYGKICHFE